MGWQDLLAPTEPEELTLPWIEGRKVHSQDRTWTIKGKRPKDQGWYKFKITGGRVAKLLCEADEPDEWIHEQATVSGYLAGDRLIPDGARVHPDPEKLVDQTEPVYCVEMGLEPFTRAEAFRDREGRLIFIQTAFPLGPEEQVLAAFEDRLPDILLMKGVTPELDLAFRWETWQRELAEQRAAEARRREIAAEAERKRQEQIEQWRKDAGTGVGRRAMAQQDFDQAARAALAISGAELLSARELNGGEMVVRYRFRGRRLECVCSKYTLRIIDAGVCLDDHRGTKGDTRFTLESLPGVIGEAIDGHKLVVWRHVPGDPGDYYDGDY